MTFAQLDAAYVWECPACKVRQYVDSVPVELNASEAREASKDTGIPEHILHSCLCCMPDEVECQSCGSVYATEGDGE